MAKEYIKDFYGRILGSVEEEPDKTVVKDFYGRILGFYDKKSDTTKDFYGRIISKGNTAVGLIYKK